MSAFDAPEPSAFVSGEPALLVIAEGKLRAEGLIVSSDGPRSEVTMRVEVIRPQPDTSSYEALRTVVEALGGERIEQDEAIAAHDAAAQALGFDPHGIPTPRQHLQAGRHGLDAERTLRREGWRPRLVLVEQLLYEALDRGRSLQGIDGPKVKEARGLIADLIDGDTKPSEGLVRLDADDLATIESWFGVMAGEGFDDGPDYELRDRLRREVNP